MTANITKRQELGQHIAAMRVELGLTRHTIGDKTRSSEGNVDRWERGTLCPTSHEWTRLCDVYRKFNAPRYKEIFQQAALEQRVELMGAPQDHVDTAGDVDAAVQLLVDALPNLRTLTITVDDAGEIGIAFKTRRIVEVEEDGERRVKRRSS